MYSGYGGTLKNFGLYLKNITSGPGVYSMIDNGGQVIYIGKAKCLRRRIASYISDCTDIKTQQLVSQVHSIEITVTRNEVEALLLEFQLIQKLKPKYNILFKDNKSYPYILLANRDNYPQLLFYRGKRGNEGEYFGPYPSVRSVRKTLDMLQRVFRLRQCGKIFFSYRTRPCLQYQIKRCSAPCVGLISKMAYQDDFYAAKKFLLGKTTQLIEFLAKKMEVASEILNYEKAARLREQVVGLRKIQRHQVIVDLNANMNLDVLGVANTIGIACVHLLTIRGGRILGSRQYFTKGMSLKKNKVEVLEIFILQYYLCIYEEKQLPNEILTSAKLNSKSTIMLALKDHLNNDLNFRIDDANFNGDKAKWVEMAERSAKQAITSKFEVEMNHSQSFLLLGEAIGCEKHIQRIECFDISHLQGDSVVGVCVVFHPQGALKSEYRRYNVSLANGGDDCASLLEVLRRHYKCVCTLGRQVTDLVLIDGGIGQLSIAEQVIMELQLPQIMLMAIAKSSKRKSGLETLYLSSVGDKLELKSDSLAFRYILQIRDEAHRFAITGHRTKIVKRQLHSQLENIPSVGILRRQRLLKQFGGLQEVQQASVEELRTVQGISKVLAEKIYIGIHGSK